MACSLCIYTLCNVCPSFFHAQVIPFFSLECWLVPWLACLIELCVQLNSATQSCPTLCDPMDCREPGFPVHHQLLEPTQAHVHWINDAIQLSHPLLPPSPPVLNLSQHQDLIQWVVSFHQVVKALELQL